MRAFHIDMNIGQFRKDYLEKWLRKLSLLGYDTIFWELEDAVQWDTCPECVAPDAFSKSEFKELLKLCDELNLTSIPILQTVAHCEYVLKIPKWNILSESKGEIQQYCLRNSKVTSFIKDWIDEYLELFGEVAYFHLGADEARSLGKCNLCREFVFQNSLSELYIDYVNQLVKHLHVKNITPMIWGDMVLSHPETVEKLPSYLIILDWMYDVYVGSGNVFVWGKQGLTKNEDIESDTMRRFGQFLYPLGNEPGRNPDPFYTADYLKSKGFKVLTCPSSASWGDNFVAPRNWYHMINCWDSFKKGTLEHDGTVLTSWTVHLFPWELQEVCIRMLKYQADNRTSLIDSYEKEFAKEVFGTSELVFFKACGLLSGVCLFTTCWTLGFKKDKDVVRDSYISDYILQMTDADLITELKDCQDKKIEYEQALKLFEQFEKEVSKGFDLILYWNLAAKNLINRSAAAIILLSNEITYRFNIGTDADLINKAVIILTEMKLLRNKTEELYLEMIKPVRVRLIIDWMYNSVENAIENIIKR